MPDRHDDLVAALRDLGDRLDLADPAVTPRTTDPVAAALRRITAGAPGTAAAHGTSGAAPPAAARTPAAGPATPGGGGAGRRPAGNRGGARPPRQPGPGRRLAAVTAALVVVASAAALALPGPRAALARALGIGGVRVETTAEAPAGVAAAYDLGRPVTLGRALDLAPGPLAPAAAGEPSGAFAGRPMGAVTLVWPATEHLPEIEGDGDGTDGIGLVVTAMRGSPERPSVVKRAGPETTVEAVTVGGRPGYWISGAPHEMRLLDLAGDPVALGVRLAGNTLVWADRGTTYRLESGLDRSSAIELAETIR
jgi:hypothetical protein